MRIFRHAWRALRPRPNWVREWKPPRLRQDRCRRPVSPPDPSSHSTQLRSRRAGRSTPDRPHRRVRMPRQPAAHGAEASRSRRPRGRPRDPLPAFPRRPAFWLWRAARARRDRAVARASARRPDARSRRIGLRWSPGPATPSWSMAGSWQSLGACRSPQVFEVAFGALLAIAQLRALGLFGEIADDVFARERARQLGTRLLQLLAGRLQLAFVLDQSVLVALEAIGQSLALCGSDPRPARQRRHQRRDDSLLQSVDRTPQVLDLALTLAHDLRSAVDLGLRLGDAIARPLHTQRTQLAQLLGLARLGQQLRHPTTSRSCATVAAKSAASSERCCSSAR